MQNIADFFEHDGPLASVIDGFIPREAQIAMAEAVAAALQTGQELVVEAGTGTGKTYAYLIPALLSGQAVILSTGTRHLQDQLFHRDLPLLTRAIGRPVKVALLKGRANYLCRHRLQLALSTPMFPGLEGSSRQRLPRIEQWSQQTKLGDIAELAQVPESDPVWTAVTSTKDNCLGQECPEYQRCHLLNARKEAQSAQVVVVNHHLLLADLSLREDGFEQFLPAAHAIVVDEAHQFPDTAAQFFGIRLSTRAIVGLLKDIRLECTRLGVWDKDMEKIAWSVETKLGALHSQLTPLGETIDWALLSWEVKERWAEWVDEFKNILTRCDQLAESEATLKPVTRRVSEWYDLAKTLSAFDEANGIQWIDVNVHGFTVEFAPFEVSKRLAEQRDKHPKTWIYTSATLAVGDDFSHFCERVGLSQPATLRLESPFDFTTQARLMIPSSLPEPTDPCHTRAVLEMAWPLVEAAQGKTFMLFTSHRALKQAAQYVKDRLGPKPRYPLFVQGDAPRDTLIRQFREAGNAILLGTASFWEGVDVRGQALSVVIIDKLPFQSPDDPLLRARLKGLEQQGQDAFRSLQLPQAVLALKQGIGRLIRDQQDYGVVFIGDRRLKSKGYGKLIMRALPPMPLCEDMLEATAFLQAHVSHNPPSVSGAS